jgi:hypothetical protein
MQIEAELDGGGGGSLMMGEGIEPAKAPDIHLPTTVKDEIKSNGEEEEIGDGVMPEKTREDSTQQEKDGEANRVGMEPTI